MFKCIYYHLVKRNQPVFFRVSGFGILSFFFLSVLCTQTEKGTTSKAAVANPQLMQIATKDTIRLKWDNPNDSSVVVGFYQVYYHTVADTTWKLLKDSLSTTTATIRRTMLPVKDSVFYFGTRAIGVNGKKSKITSSSDSTAYPKNWVVYWK